MRLSEPKQTDNPNHLPNLRHPHQPTRLIMMMVLLAMVVVFAWQLLMRPPLSDTQRIGKLAPDFSLTLYNSEGETFTLSEQRGKIVILNFWGTWCLPCRQEAPILQRIATQYAPHGVTVVGVNFKDTPEDAQAFLAEFGITYLTGLDHDEAIIMAYGLTAAPETYIIASDGTIHAFFWGEVGEAQLTAAIEPLLP